MNICYINIFVVNMFFVKIDIFIGLNCLVTMENLLPWQQENCAVTQLYESILTLSGPAFSVVRQARGGLRGPDAKNQS